MRVCLLLISLLLAQDAAAQGHRVGYSRGRTIPAPAQYVLENVAGEIGAYSFRKVSGSYSGNIFEVARSFAVTSKDNGTKTITLTGDKTSLISAGNTVYGSQSFNSEIVLTVASATLNGGNTDVVVNESISSVDITNHLWQATDIGLSGAFVDTTAMKNYASEDQDGNLYAWAWYSQDGSSNDATVGIRILAGPLVVENNVLVRDPDGHPAIKYASTDFTMTAPITVTSTQDLYLAVVGDWYATTGQHAIAAVGVDGTANAEALEIIWDQGAVRVYQGYDTGTGVTHFLQYPPVEPSFYVARASVSSDVRINGQSVETKTFVTVDGSGSRVIAIGGDQNDLQTPDAYISEVFVFEGISDVDTFEADIRDEYGFWTANPNEGAILAQVSDDDVLLYDWLETLSAADFDVPRTAITYASSGATVRDLYGIYYGLQNDQANSSLVQYPSSAFVLDDGAGEGIEGDGSNVRIVKKSGSGEAGYGTTLEGSFFYTFNATGISNPYHNDTGLANRLISQAVAHMMQTKHFLYYTGSGYTFPEYTGMGVMQTMTAFNAARDGATGFTNTHQAAFLRLVNDIIEFWDAKDGPRDANTNMDSKTFYGLSLLYKAATEEGLTDIATNARELSAKWLLGSRSSTDPGLANGYLNNVIFHSAGYIGERSMPETSYAGISIYYIAKAAAVVDGVAGWEWLWDTDGVIDRMAKFKSYNIFRDPDGVFNGASGYGIREPDPYPHDQSQSEGRDLIVAQLSDYGKQHFNKRYTSASTALTSFSDPSLSTVESLINSELTAHYSSMGEITAEYLTMDTGDERWWANRTSTVAIDYYDPTFYDMISDMIATSDDSLQIPLLKTGAYNLTFGRDGDAPEFWTFKATDGSREFAAFIESFARDATQTNGYSSWFGGGTVQSFWTSDGGLAINSRGDSHSNASVAWANAENWAAHHLWGDAGGVTFSSSQHDSRISSYTYDDSTTATQMTATGTPDRASGSWTGTVTYERTIDKVSDGVTVLTSLTTDSQDNISTLWETIPVHLRHYSQATDATIEYTTDALTGGPYTWTALSTTLVGSITAVRLGRDHGSGAKYVYVVPMTAKGMRLSTSVFTANGLEGATDRHRALMIDVHPNTGNAQTIASASVTYDIQTVEP